MGEPDRNVWGYITTYRTMQPPSQPVGHPLTTQTLQMGMVRAQAKRGKCAKIGLTC